MSQKKVDEYKKYKANRKEILAKQKRARKRNKILGIVATVFCMGIFGYWGVYTYQVETAPDVTFAELVSQDEYGIIVPTIAEK